MHLKTALLAAGFALAGFVSLSQQYLIPPRDDLKGAPYPEWAHYHWVWLNRWDQNQQTMTDMVKGYKDRNITVGAINIDSGWSTGFNNFDVDTKKFPDLKTLVS